MKRVYIAGPITNGGSGPIQWENVDRAMDASSILIHQGFAPLCPALTAYQALRLETDDDIPPISWDQWLRVDKEWLQMAGAVVRLNGPSRGADEECRWATEWDIRVYMGLEAFLCRQPLFNGKLPVLDDVVDPKTAAWVRRVDGTQANGVQRFQDLFTYSTGVTE
jgi:hypothetical protein